MAPPEIPELDLIVSLRKVAREMGRPPKTYEYDERGEYCSKTISQRFGGWHAALRRAHLDPDDIPGREYPHDDEELIAELRAAYEVLGRSPKAREMRAYGDFSDRVYENRWGTWNNALKAAKLPINTPGRECAMIKKEEFVAEVERLADELGHPPSTKEFDRQARISIVTYRRWWDSWPDVLTDVGVLQSA